jgi:hypothetical protein
MATSRTATMESVIKIFLRVITLSIIANKKRHFSFEGLSEAAKAAPAKEAGTKIEARGQ